MFKRGLKRALAWCKKNRDFSKSRKQSDCRVVAAALRMTRELALTKPRIAGAHLSDRRSIAPPAADPGDIHAENNAEIDRVLAHLQSDKLVATKHHNKVIHLRAWGNC